MDTHSETSNSDLMTILVNDGDDDEEDDRRQNMKLVP